MHLRLRPILENGNEIERQAFLIFAIFKELNKIYKERLVIVGKKPHQFEK